MKEERDQWDKDICDKMFNFEVETPEADWEAIASQLPASNQVEWRRVMRYWAGAAAAVAAILLGGIAYYDRTSVSNQQVKDYTHFQANTPIPEQSGADSSSTLAASTPATFTSSATTHAIRRISSPIAEARPTAIPTTEIASEEETPSDLSEQGAAHTKAIATFEQQEQYRQPKEAKKKKTVHPKRWSFGMGAGSLSLGADQTVLQYVTHNSLLRSEKLFSMNALGAQLANLPKTDIHHKTPIGFGLSASRQLSDRFYLLTGLNYSYLRSSWNTNGTYHTETDQRLHFIGVPLSVAYRLAQWDKLSLYASAGGMAEINVAGKQQMELFSDNISIMKQTEHVRMKEWLWSVNSKVGVSYPVIRFVSAYAEVGASYYFDNGSAVETIHSEKPFDVSFNVGLRLGF